VFDCATIVLECGRDCRFAACGCFQGEKQKKEKKEKKDQRNIKRNREKRDHLFISFFLSFFSFFLSGDCVVEEFCCLSWKITESSQSIICNCSTIDS
jgi:hypothetical protein